jgi:hypothetical protein
MYYNPRGKRQVVDRQRIINKVRVQEGENGRRAGGEGRAGRMARQAGSESRQARVKTGRTSDEGAGARQNHT